LLGLIAGAAEWTCPAAILRPQRLESAERTAALASPAAYSKRYGECAAEVPMFAKLLTQNHRETRANP
jgi:hypothetical protein